MRKVTGMGDVTVERPRDEKGRLAISHMSDRELLEESATNMRFVMDAFLQMVESPMLSGMAKMLGNGRR